MAITAQTTKIYIVDRITYDTLSQLPESEGGIKTNGIYFIRETSSQTAKIASLCVGKSNQCDVLDISGVQNVDFTDPAHNYNIPVDYRVKDKLLVYSQIDSSGNRYFRTLMWDGSKFLDCMGGNIIEPDNITIRKHDNKVFGVGASLYRKSVNIDGDTYIGLPGSEIYNYIFDSDEDSEEYQHNNIAINYYGSAFGVANINRGIASTAFNIGDIDNTPTNIKNTLNPQYSKPSSFSYSGIGSGIGCNSFGASNNVNGNCNTAGGIYNQLRNKYASFAWGQNLNVTQGNFPTAVFGKNNYDGNDIIFAVGNGSDDTHRTNAFSLDTSGNGRFQGNVLGEDGVSLVSLTNSTTVSADDATVTLSILPQNSAELTLSDHTVETVNVLSLSQTTIDGEQGIETVSTPRDYSSIIIFKKSVNTTSADSLMVNFTAIDDTKIYLMNPDIDISSMTVIHIMLYNDGFHVCAIVAGYNDITT